MSRFSVLRESDYPETWSVSLFGDLTTFRIGRTPPRNQSIFWDNGHYPWVSISDYRNFQLILQTKERISEEAHAKVFRKDLVPAGHYIMSFKLTLGRVARLGVNAYHNEAIFSFLPDAGRINPDFLAFYLSQIDYREYQDTAVKGMTLNSTKISNLEIALPPLAEQRKIAAVLSLVQRAIDQQERLIVLTTELKKTLMHELFTEGLRGEPQKETEIGLIPESWDVARLDEVALIERGKFSHRPRNDPRFYDGGTPFVQTGDVTESEGRIGRFSQSLNDLGLSVSKVFPKGTILITIAANIGYSGILEFDSACPDSLIGLTTKADITAEYLQFYLSTQQEEMDRLAPRGTQKNINIQFLKPWPVALPKLEEQQEIVNLLCLVDQRKQFADRNKQALTDLFRTLLHQLMTAQIRVDDLDLSALMDVEPVLVAGD